jgi:hypothetical protein
MTAKNSSSHSCDTTLVRHTYEMLRANALGGMNRASEFTVFLRNGMSAWIRALGEHDSARREIRRQRSHAFSELELDMPHAGLASILTDAILKAARPARHPGGTT